MDGGTDIASQLLAQQQSAGQAAQMGFQTAADAEQRALQAIAQSGQMAGAMRTQQVGEDAARAQAMDRINRFNTPHRQQLQAANYATLNAAEAANLQAAQQLENQNVNRRSAQNLQHTQAYQTDFQNRAKRIEGIASANRGLAGAQQQTGQMWGRLGGSLLSSGGSMLASGLKPTPAKPQSQPQFGSQSYNTDYDYDPNRLRSADGAVVTSDNQGGMVPGNEFAGDRVDAQVNSGEMILNVEQQQNLLDLLAGKTNQIDPNIPIVQDNPQMQEQPMQEESMIDPLAAAAQQQQPQQPMMPQQPMEDPMAALAGMPQEQPVMAADGVVVPQQPWQQVVYPPKAGAIPMTPMDPTMPVAPPPPPPAMTEAPLEVVNVPDTPQMAPVTEFGTAAPVEQPFVDQIAQPQPQPQAAPEDTGTGSELGYSIGKGVAGLGDAVSQAFGGRGQAFQQIQAGEERDRVRAEKKEAQQSESKQRMIESLLKRKQDMEDFKTKEDYKANIKERKESLAKDKALTGTVEEKIAKMSSDGKNSVGMLTNALNAFAKAENILMTDGYNIKDASVKTQLQQYFDMIVNDVLRNESGAAISETEYERIRGMLPDLTDETISPGIRAAKMQQIRDKIVLALGARGLNDKAQLGAYLDKQVGFYKSVNPNSKLLADFRAKTEEAAEMASGDPEFAKISDQDLDAEIAAEEAKLAQ